MYSLLENELIFELFSFIDWCPERPMSSSHFANDQWIEHQKLHRLHLKNPNVKFFKMGRGQSPDFGHF